MSATISATTLAEALIVAEGRGLRAEMADPVEGLNLEIVSVSAVMARRVADAYAQWGKGVNPAGLNFGDCFAYDPRKPATVPCSLALRGAGLRPHRYRIRL